MKIYKYLQTGHFWIYVSDSRRPGYVTLRRLLKPEIVRDFQEGHFKNQFIFDQKLSQQVSQQEVQS